MDRAYLRGIDVTGEMSPLPPGQIIKNTRYRVLGRVGAGAMGEVYAAEHIDLEKRVALKTLLAEAARKPEAMERFREEARTASRIGSPFICDVTDFGQLPDGRVFYVMEYLAGRSLRETLKAGPLSLSRAIAILRQVAKALGAAHEKGVIHLDVKPDNVMLTKGGRRDDAVKVVDFGLAALSTQRVRPGAESREHTVVGTPEYVAPERIRGAVYDHRSDIYSLGAMAYEMLTGHCPFEDDDLVVVLRKHVVVEPMRLSKRAPDRTIPEDLETLVLQMLAKDPQARPQSMAVVEALLCEAQIAARISTDWDDLELPVVEESWMRRLADRMPSRRGRLMRRLAIAGSGVGVLGAALAVFFFFQVRTEVRVVTVPLTETEEAETVEPFLLKANEAALAERYVRPSDNSALFFIQRAEEEATRVDRQSKGAARLRKEFAGSLKIIGNELWKHGLRESAVLKYNESLAFAPDDELERKAGMSRGERKRRSDTTVAVERSDAESVRDLSADLFTAAQKGRYSRARQGLQALLKGDPSGNERARLSDALRELANDAWKANRREDARALYQMIGVLDPNDPVAVERAAGVDEESAPPPRPVVVEKPAPVAPARREPVAADDVANERPRDPKASKELAGAGASALSQGRLAQAEEAFNRAVRADSQNAAAIAGLAEVAFERARYTDALDLARRAARYAPKTSRYHVILGDAYFKILRYDEALAAYTKAQSLAPKDAEVAQRIARSKAKLGR